MSLHNGIDTVSYITFGYHSKTFGAASPIIIDGRSYRSQACINSLYATLGKLETGGPPAGGIGGWHYWPPGIGFPWRRIWKVWG